MSVLHVPASGRQSPVLSAPVDQRLQISLELLKSYVAEHGWEGIHSTTRIDGFHLGHWVHMRRSEYRRGKMRDWLRRELEAIPDWVWDPHEEEIRRKLALLRRYVEQRGWDCLTSRTVVDGVNVGSWIMCQKRAYAAGTLADWLWAELVAIPGCRDWITRKRALTRKEQTALEALRQFIAEFGWLAFNSATVVNGIQVGRFVGRWRTARRRGQLDPRLAEQLEAIPGWSWESTYLREHHRWALALLKQYVAEHGCESIRRTTRVQEFNLGTWCQARRQAYRRGKLDHWLTRELEAIPGWRWSRQDRAK